MRAVELKVLKTKLSEFVRLAERGETVLVTDRDRVVAELVPPDRSRSPLLADALLADAMRQGLISPGAAASERDAATASCSDRCCHSAGRQASGCPLDVHLRRPH